jgi:hypothetical protein
MGIRPTGGGDSIPDLSTLPAPVRSRYEASFGDATGPLFMVSVPFAVASLLCILFIREVPLRTTLDVEDSAAPAERAPRA